MKKTEYIEFEFKDIDYLYSPSGWLEAKLSNRLKEGYEIWRDLKNMSWKGRKKITKQSLI